MNFWHRFTFLVILLLVTVALVRVCDLVEYNLQELWTRVYIQKLRADEIEQFVGLKR